MTNLATQGRTYSAAHYLLELQGPNVVAIVRSIDGIGMKSEIIDHRVGQSHALWRQIGKPRYQDIKIEFGMALSKHLYRWIEAFFRGEVERRHGAICAGDFHYNERSRYVFQEALISEIVVPKLDGSDNSPCYMSATIVPEIAFFAKVDGRHQLAREVGLLRQKLWTTANFDITLDGEFGTACRRCTKIDSFTIKQEIQEYHSGSRRAPLRLPGLMEFPNIVFYVPESDARPFIDHHARYGIRGEVQRSPRLTGAIRLLDNSGASLCTFHLYGVDIASVGADKSEAGSTAIKEVRIELAVESITFEYEEHGLG